MSDIASSNHRDDRRHKSFLVARLNLASGAVRCHILNLSSSGALVHATTNMSHGPHVELQFAGGQHRGRVVWANGGRLGFHFDRRLSGVELERALACAQ